MSHNDPTARAADIVAQQIEGIVQAAQASADQVASAAQAEAEQIRAQARESAQAELEAARRSALRLGEEARQEAADRISEAQTAADDVLAEARAVSAGLRQLGHLLNTHAERILRDVQSSHRAISADLRAASAQSAAPRDEDGEPRPAPSQRPPRGNPFADLAPPSWVDDSGLTARKRG